MFPITCANKYFPPGIDYRIELTRNDDDFLLLCADDLDVKIIVKDIYFMIHNVHVNEQIASLAQEQFMREKLLPIHLLKLVLKRSMCPLASHQ